MKVVFRVDAFAGKIYSNTNKCSSAIPIIIFKNVVGKFHVKNTAII